jgi:hypothetical protein
MQCELATSKSFQELMNDIANLGAPFNPADLDRVIMDVMVPLPASGKRVEACMHPNVP